MKEIKTKSSISWVRVVSGEQDTKTKLCQFWWLIRRTRRKSCCSNDFKPFK